VPAPAGATFDARIVATEVKPDALEAEAARVRSTAATSLAATDPLERADAVLPASGGRRGVEPMCAGYGPACESPIRSAIAAGDLRAISFHSAVRTCILPAETVAAFGDPSTLFFNVNSQDDLTQADALWRRLASSQS